MALVTTNNQRALTQLVKPALVAGAKTMIDNREHIWNGVKWVLANVARRRRRRETQLVTYQQALPNVIAAPVAMTRRITGSKPKFKKSTGSVRISHREYVSQVEGISGGAFRVNNGTTNDFSLNPMNFTAFTWLPTIASNFDQYKFVSVRLEYIPLVSTTEPGRVALFFDKDSEDRGPDDRSALANYAHLSEISPWGETGLSIPVDNVKRLNDDNATSDPKLINLGKFGWATYGGNSGNVYGDIFIHYTVDLFEAQPTTTLLQSIGGNLTSTSVNNGPKFVTAEVINSTTAIFQFRVPGVYTFVFFNNVTSNTLNSPTIFSGGTINTSYGNASAARITYIAQVTITTNTNLIIGGMTGQSNWQVLVTRSNKDNQLTVV
nr:structural protein [Tolivirales sp.]